MEVPGPVEKTSQVVRADGNPGIEVCPGFYQLILFLTCQQKLTKDELKAWIKDRKLPTPAKQCTKEGEPSLTRIPVADALVDLLQAIVSTPLEKQPSASDIAKVIKLVSFPLSFILIFIMMSSLQRQVRKAAQKATKAGTPQAVS
jgi:hypothetical protein